MLYTGHWWAMGVCVCVCGITLCPRQVSVHDQWCMPSLSLSPCPEKSNQGNNLLLLLKNDFQSREGSSTRRQVHRGALCLSLALNRLASLPLEVPSSKWKTQYTIVLAVAVWKGTVSSPPEAPFLKQSYPLTTSWHAFSPLFLRLLFLSWLWSCNNGARWICMFCFFPTLQSHGFISTGC